jgi:hypothetical protein
MVVSIGTGHSTDRPGRSYVGQQCPVLRRLRGLRVLRGYPPLAPRRFCLCVRLPARQIWTANANDRKH